MGADTPPPGAGWLLRADVQPTGSATVAGSGRIAATGSTQVVGSGHAAGAASLQ